MESVEKEGCLTPGRLQKTSRGKGLVGKAALLSRVK